MNIVCPYQDCQQPLEITVDDAGAVAMCPACRRPMQLPARTSFPHDELNAARNKDQCLTPATAPPREDSKPAADREKVACCPQCVGVYDEKTQNFVHEVLQLKETGAHVSDLPVTCACGSRARFEEVQWIPKTAAGKGAVAGDVDDGDGLAASQPPPTRRDRAVQLAEAGVAAASAGDSEGARERWTDATQADTSWSVPFFNLAKLSLDRGDRYAASVFLGMAEDRAQKGTSPDDARIIQQLPDLKSQIELGNFDD